MSTVKLWTDAGLAANLRVQAVFSDIRATRQSDLVNNRWCIGESARAAGTHMGKHQAGMVTQSALDPLIKELIYIALSTANGCGYCVHSHATAALAKGLTAEQHAEFLVIVGMAAETNALANAMQILVNAEFLI